MTVTDLALINVRKGTAAEWVLANSTLLAGEIGYETDTKLMKMGDGATLWNSLGYMPEQLAKQITSAADKPTPVDADEIPLADSAATFGLKKLTWANLKATLLAIYNGLYEVIGNYATTATAADTTTLTVSSPRRQVFTGATTQTVVLPVTSTLPNTGYEYKIINKSTGIVTVQSSDASVIYAVPANTTATFMCILLTGTTAASWSFDWAGASAAPTGAFSGCALSKSVAQSISATTYTAITFDTDIFDVGGFHDTVTNNTRITIPSGKAGYYRVWANIISSTDNSLSTARIYKNGSIWNMFYGGRPGGTGGGDVNFSTTMNLAVGDYIEIFAYGTSITQIDGEPQANKATTFGVDLLGA